MDSAPLAHGSLVAVCAVFVASGCRWILPFASNDADSRPPSFERFDREAGSDSVTQLDQRSSAEESGTSWTDLRGKPDGPPKPDGPAEMVGPAKMDGPAKPDGLAKMDGPGDPCAAPSTLVVMHGLVAHCRATTARTQCQGHLLCKSPWQLCTASQFLTMGGKDGPWSDSAWLASCIRNGNQVMAPTNSACSACSVGSKGNETISWECQTLATGAQTTQPYVGVAASGKEYRVGTSTTDCAYWAASPAANTLFGSACCQ